jgi:hypothetical protein
VHVFVELSVDVRGGWWVQVHMFDWWVRVCEFVCADVCDGW